jgi:peptidylprolyl isomerase/FKBP-type peptidyl-prolyl cis-trans isomerase FklB
MVYLLADVGAAHTRPLLLPPLGHVDSIERCVATNENVLRKEKQFTVERSHWHNRPHLRRRVPMSRYFFYRCGDFFRGPRCEKPPENDAHDLAYSLGASLGERLRQRFPICNFRRWSKVCSKPIKASHGAETSRSNRSSRARSAGRRNTWPQSEWRCKTNNVFSPMKKPGRCSRTGGWHTADELAPGMVQGRANGKVQVLYVGRLPDGTVFDQNSQPQWFSLDSVISGWRSALQKCRSARNGAW